jgi:hypothetical protein
MNVGTIRFIAITFLITYVRCFGPFWNRNDAHVVDQQIPNQDSMNQNLVVNLNYSPTQIKTPLSLPENFLSNLPLQQWQSQTRLFLYQKRYFIGASLLLSSYIYACHLIVKANKYLENMDTWASWRQDIPHELLVTIPQQELAKDLLLEVQRKYSNPQNPTDFLSPLITFIHAIDDEILMMQRITTAYTWTKKLHLDYILPINEKLFCKTEEKLKKLSYLKQVFLAWAAEYKVNHNKSRHPRIRKIFKQK